MYNKSEVRGVPLKGYVNCTLERVFQKKWMKSYPVLRKTINFDTVLCKKSIVYIFPFLPFCLS